MAKGTKDEGRWTMDEMIKDWTMRRWEVEKIGNWDAQS